MSNVISTTPAQDENMWTRERLLENSKREEHEEEDPSIDPEEAARRKARAAKKAKMNGLWWGRMKDAPKIQKATSLVFSLVLISALSFCQLAFFPIGGIGGGIVYVILTVAPLLMCAFMFGPLMGLVLGACAGAMLFGHANLLPLDFYEVYYFSHPVTIALFGVAGLLSALAFRSLSRSSAKGGVATALTALVCLMISAFISGLGVLLVVLLHGGFEIFELLSRAMSLTPATISIQIVLDALVALILCLAARKVTDQVLDTSIKHELAKVFQNWMIIVAACVFLISCSAIFTASTVICQATAKSSMLSETLYLAEQISSDANGTSTTSDLSKLLRGYMTDQDGSVFITDATGTILATDNEESWPVGSNFGELSGYTNEIMTETGDEVPTDTCLILDGIAKSEEVQELQVLDPETGMSTMETRTTVASAFDGGYVVIIWDIDMIYASRFGTMFSMTMLALLLIISISILANVLLRNMVVKHIDDTNASLEKITYGDLSERVKDQDTAEFDSLSEGINATVGALDDMIHEVEERNAKDLETAKAIQEDALPMDFPAFPHIDRFDIYASMKTAKEVGGDFYDFFEIEAGPGGSDGSGSHRVALICSDVAGKSIPGSLFMMTSKTQLKNHLNMGMDVDEAVNAANHQLCLGNDAGMFVTTLVFVLDYETGHVEYVNAGHNPPLLLHDGKWSWLTEVSGMPLGLFDGIPYTKLEFDMEPEDTLYTYTDGVTEAMNEKDELFTEERLEETLNKYTGMNPRSICVGVRRALTDFTQDAEQSDDITMLSVKYGVPPEDKAVMILDSKSSESVHVANYISAELHRRKAPKSADGLILAAEEIFANVCEYAYPDEPGEVRISFEYEAAPPTLSVTIEDNGAKFDPTAVTDPVTVDEYDNVIDVPEKGLGIFLARKNTDEMTYERRDGKVNSITLKKSW